MPESTMIFMMLRSGWETGFPLGPGGADRLQATSAGQVTNTGGPGAPFAPTGTKDRSKADTAKSNAEPACPVPWATATPAPREASVPQRFQGPHRHCAGPPSGHHRRAPADERLDKARLAGPVRHAHRHERHQQTAFADNDIGPRQHVERTRKPMESGTFRQRLSAHIEPDTFRASPPGAHADE